MRVCIDTGGGCAWSKELSLKAVISGNTTIKLTEDVETKVHILNVHISGYCVAMETVLAHN